MGPILSTIFGFLKGPIASITDNIFELRQKQLEAQSNEVKRQYDERIEVLRARRDVLMKEATSPINTWIRLLFALPFAIYIFKVVLIDKVLALGATDPLSPMLEGIMWTIIGFYFLDTTIRRFRR